MDSAQRSQLEDAQKKLSAFRSHLDLLVRGVWETKNVNSSEILSAVNELQSLVEWAAQQPDLGPESAVLVVQLQELHRIRQNLENSPTKNEILGIPDLNEGQENKLSKEDESNSEGLLDYSDIASSNILDNDEDKDQDKTSVILSTNTSLSHASEFSASTDESTVFVSDSDMAEDMIDIDSLDFKNEIKSSLNAEDDQSESTVTNLVNDIEVKDLLSNDIELFVKSHEENKCLVSNESEMSNPILKLEDLLSSNVEDPSESITENKHLDANKFQVSENLKTEELDLLLSDSVIPKCDIQHKELVSCDFEELPESNIEIQDFLTDVVAESNTLVQDLISSNNTEVSENNTMVKDLISSNNTEVSENNAMVKYLLSKDAEVILKGNTATVVQDLLSSNAEVAVENNSAVPDLVSSEIETTEKTNTRIQKFLRRDTEGVEKCNTEIQNLVSSDNTVLMKNRVEIDNFPSKNIASAIPKFLRNDVTILETNEDDTTTEWTGDRTNDPLDVCMFAIRNLYDSLRTKENELLKLSVMQTDQKHIEALQNVIIGFHKDITNLNRELDKTKKENTQLKEQVLELEEAENDARLEAQKLEQKLVFLQEKDSHSQSEISQLKQSFKKSMEKITEKELVEKEIRSQTKYMETLVQKYEDQIKALEAKEVAAFKKEKDDADKRRKAEETAKREKKDASTKGTQTYPFQIEIENNNESAQENSNNNKCVSDLTQVETKVTNTLVSQNISLSASEATSIKEQFVLGEIDSISQKELMERLRKLMAEDAGLQQQIHHVDQINLDLWKKLQSLENNIGECKRKDINETDLTVNANEPCGFKDSVLDTETVNSNTVIQTNDIPAGNLISLDQNEQYINERLTKLEEINISFENELKTRDNICKEKEKKYSEWMETERQLMSELKRIANERDCLVNQVVNLKKEKEGLEERVLQQQTELNTLKDKNQKEIVKIRTEQEAMAMQLHHKVNQLITKEKELLKMITKLKSERSQNQDKSELERLKCNYIELQLELSSSREDIRKLEEGFEVRLDECVSRHLQEETRLTIELERLRNEKSRCDKMINDLQMKQHHLLEALERQEKELLLTRECYRKSLEETEEVHRSVETGLKSQLQKMEEVTVIATTALMEERMRVEKELQDNIKDLRTKEELYKAKIADLEQDVNHLHEELHKVAEESEVQENHAEKKTERSDELTNLTSVANYLQNDSIPLHPSQVPEADLKELSREIGSSSQPLHQAHVPETDLKPLPHGIARDYQLMQKSQAAEKDLKMSSAHGSVSGESLTEVNKQQSASDKKPEKKAHEKHTRDENVNHLRAQVRELQAQLEQISGEVAEMSPVKSGPAITAPCMGLQKEELDYAEVDECVADWRRATQNLPAAKNFQTQFQALYGDKYATGYRNNYLNEKAPVEESNEENDYDEVLPRPTNFHVVQQVGPDTLLVGWNYVNPSVLDGFEVYLDDQVHERIYIPDRTKALISGLNLRKPINLSICALSRYGQMSEPAILEVLPDRNTMGFENDEDDEYKDFEDPMNTNKRPYSMEW